jgi:hypothetical protein
MDDDARAGQHRQAGPAGVHGQERGRREASSAGQEGETAGKNDGDGAEKASDAFHPSFLSQPRRPIFSSSTTTTPAFPPSFLSTGQVRARPSPQSWLDSEASSLPLSSVLVLEPCHVLVFLSSPDCLLAPSSHWDVSASRDRHYQGRAFGLTLRGASRVPGILSLSIEPFLATSSRGQRGRSTGVETPVLRTYRLEW